MLFLLVFTISIKCITENRPVASILTECNGQERCVADSDTVTISGSTFESIINNDASEGGAVSLTFCVFTCTNSVFNNCSSSQNGGAIYYFNQKENSKKATISNCNFSSCHASLKGGAVYFHQSKHETNEFINCLFDSNYADSDEPGNNLWAFSQSILIQNCTFSNQENYITGPLLVLQNSCQKAMAWSCAITCCSFIYVIKDNSTSTETINAIRFLGGSSLQPIEISKTCFIVDSSSNSINIQYIKSATPITFENYNVFSVSQDNSVSCSNVNYNGEIDYGQNECIIKEYIAPSTSIPTISASPIATRPKATPRPTKTPSQSPKPTSTRIPTATSNIYTSNSYSASKQDPTSVYATSQISINTDQDDDSNGKIKMSMTQFIMYIGIAIGGFVVIVIILIIVFVIIKKRKYQTILIEDDSQADPNTEYLKDQQLADDI